MTRPGNHIAHRFGACPASTCVIRGIDAEAVAIRRLVGRHIAGRGVEVGPGAHPFPLSSPGATVWHPDRWRPDQNRALFAEIDDDLIRPDVVCDLNTKGLSMLRSQSLDFVIAGHVVSTWPTRSGPSTRSTVCRARTAPPWCCFPSRAACSTAAGR